MSLLMVPHTTSEQLHFPNDTTHSKIIVFRTTALSKRQLQQNYRPQNNCTFQKTLTAKSSSSEQLHFPKDTHSQIIVIHRNL
jgi:hypothetical protein